MTLTPGTTGVMTILESVDNERRVPIEILERWGFSVSPTARLSMLNPRDENIRYVREYAGLVLDQDGEYMSHPSASRDRTVRRR